MQLDLFLHGRDVALQNDVIAALRARNAANVKSALDRFAAEFPDHETIVSLTILLAELSQRATAPTYDRDALAVRIREIDDVLLPAAVRVFGRGEATQWLSPVWSSLANAADELPFDPECQTAHAGFLFLRAADWDAAEARILTIPSWRRVPVPLAWMIEARFHRTGLEDVWSLLIELAWMAASVFRELALRLNSPPLHRLLQDFEAGVGDEEGLDASWFPVWLLISAPAMVTVMKQTQAGGGKPPERAARLIMELLLLEKQGRHAELVAQRRRLRDQHEGLYRYYMKSR